MNKLNVFNRAQFGPPIVDFSSASFGRITTTVNTGATGSGTPAVPVHAPADLLIVNQPLG